MAVLTPFILGIDWKCLEEAKVSRKVKGYTSPSLTLHSMNIIDTDYSIVMHIHLVYTVHWCHTKQHIL